MCLFSLSRGRRAARIGNLGARASRPRRVCQAAHLFRQSFLPVALDIFIIDNTLSYKCRDILSENSRLPCSMLCIYVGSGPFQHLSFREEFPVFPDSCPKGMTIDIDSVRHAGARIPRCQQQGVGDGLRGCRKRTGIRLGRSHRPRGARTVRARRRDRVSRIGRRAGTSLPRPSTSPSLRGAERRAWPGALQRWVSPLYAYLP